MIEVALSNNRDAFLLNNDIPSGVTLEIPEIVITKSFGTDTAITVGISIATGVPSSLIAAWLYDKFKQCRSDQITINRKEIHLTDGKVAKIIKETINKER